MGSEKHYTGSGMRAFWWKRYLVCSVALLNLWKHLQPPEGLNQKKGAALQQSAGVEAGGLEARVTDDPSGGTVQQLSQTILPYGFKFLFVFHTYVACTA